MKKVILRIHVSNIDVIVGSHNGGEHGHSPVIEPLISRNDLTFNQAYFCSIA